MIARYRDFWLGLTGALALISAWLVFPLEQKLNLGLDLQGGMHLVMEVEKDKLPEGANVRDAVDRAIEIIRNRVDALGVSEPTIQRQGESWIVVQLPGIKNPEKAKELIGKTALLEFKLVSEETMDKYTVTITGKTTPLPADLELIPSREAGEPTLLIEKAQLMTGAALADATPGTGEMGSVVVNFVMTPEGSRTFADLTSRHIKRRLAIILDGKVMSAPVIQSRISGNGQISGRFTWEDAHNLALILRAGALPAPVRTINEEVVGPSLGRDSIERGKQSAMIGTVLVLVFMGIYYRVSGLIANAALLMNLLFLLGLMALNKATLTLPGIAGIVLTMGMAVDGNVLIFERIRDELRAGKTVRAAVDAGYDRALSAIIDSHVTTLITAGILFYFGSGPIRGFAVTLFWGVSISLYTAVVVSRAIFELRKQHETLSI